MKKFGADMIFDDCEYLSSLRECLIDSSVMNEQCLVRVGAVLDSIKEKEVVHCSRHQCAMRSEIGKLIEWAQSVRDSVSNDEVAFLEEFFDELRIRFVAVAIGAGCIKSDNETDPGSVGSYFEAVVNSTRNKSLIVSHAIGDLIYASVEKNVVILFPKINSTAHANQVMAGLLYVWDHTPSGYSWVIDFSMVDNLPLLVLGTLRGYRNQLQDRKADLCMVWVRHDVLRPEDLRMLTKGFDLSSVGGYLFSRRL